MIFRLNVFTTIRLTFYSPARMKTPSLRDDFSDESVATNGNRGAAHITKGRATDDAAKGTRMVMVLPSHIDELGVLPLFGHMIDGNQNGRTGIREQLGLLTKLLKPQKFTMISDRGTFSVSASVSAQESEELCDL
ncbi:MAG: hypothetical protein R3C56_26185 [Pirellulaceae bacterium]